MNKTHTTLALFLVIVFLMPLFAFAGGEYFCVWNSNNDPPCQYLSDTCSDGDVPDSCAQFDIQNDCQVRQHECVENEKALTLDLNYPPIPTPYGYIDLDEMAERGEISISTIVVFLYSISLWIAGLIAFLGLVFAGFTYILGGANASAKNRAKRRFTNVLWGIAILLTASAVINIINPNILRLELQDLYGLDANYTNYQDTSLGFDIKAKEKPQACTSFGLPEMNTCLGEGSTMADCWNQCVNECDSLNTADDCIALAAESYMTTCINGGTNESTCVSQCADELINNALYVDTEEQRTNAEAMCGQFTSSGGGGSGEPFTSTQITNMTISCRDNMGLDNNTVNNFFSVNSAGDGVFCDNPGGNAWNNLGWCNDCSANGGDVTTCVNYFESSTKGCCATDPSICPQ
ncbi:MAG: pilin [Candidatus Spechtbacterales bacterium]|nr:pilin [Candidatus Spechtbacterales bacterium]